MAKTNRRARSPGATQSKRNAETGAWKAAWIHRRQARAADPHQHLEFYVSDKCPGYRYLFTIYAKTCNEILAEAINVLQVMKLDGPDWRQRLGKISRLEVGGSNDDFAFQAMRYHLEREKWRSVKRAAESAVAQFGLYLDSNSFEAAVQRARQVWMDYKAGKFRPLGELQDPKGLIVKPNLENLRPNETRRIIDPEDQAPLPSQGKRVADSSFWRNMIELGLVVVVKEDL